jgi:hypothetical protein
MSPRVLLNLGGGLFALLLLAAAPPAADKEQVKVSVLAILASERDDKIDQRLDCIAREVCKKHKKLKGFQIVKMTCKSLDVGSKETFELVGDQTAAVTVKQGADKDDRVQLKVAPPQMGEITYDTCCGKFLPIVTPYRTRSGELLILAVRVQPCNCK